MNVKLSKFMNVFKPYFFEDLYRKAQEEKRKGKDIINLAVGDPDIPPNRLIIDYAVREIKKAENSRYPNTRGNERFRKAVSGWHRRRHGIKLDYEKNISLLVGSKEGIAHLPVVLMNKGDICLICDPTYPTYRTGVWLVNGRIYSVPLKSENNFLPDFYKIPEKIARKAKLFFINYPNNPTGANITREYLKELVRWAKKYNIFIAQDAAYCEIYFDKPTPSIFEIPGAIDIAVEFYSVSKTYSMPGWRVGWVCGNEKVVNALNTLKENIDSGQFNAIQNTCAYALDNHEKIVPAIREKFKNRIEKFYATLTENNWRMLKPQGSCYIWAKPPVDIDSLKASDIILNNAGVLVAPGSGFGKHGEGYVRIAVTEKDDLINRAVKRISEIKWKR